MEGPGHSGGAKGYSYVIVMGRCEDLLWAISGLEKYLNSTLPVRQVTLKFCLPGALSRLPKFSNSLIIHELINGSQTTDVF